MHRSAKPPRGATKHGYTIVELMMAIGVFAIGVSGIIAMQKITLASNSHAKNLATATHISQAWMDQLVADAAQWNFPGPRNQSAASDLGDTQWLKEVENGSEWFRPVWVATRQFGPGFDALGNPVNSDDQAVFCSHLRLTWLNRDNQGVVGNGLIRAEVRTFWLRDGGGGAITDAALCSNTNNAVNIGLNPDRYHFIYNTSAIRQEPAQR